MMKSRSESSRLEELRLEFKDVPTEFALAEAEGDLSGDDFRQSHSKFWNSVGVDVKPETKIVTVYFDLEK